MSTSTVRDYDTRKNRRWIIVVSILLAGAVTAMQMVPAIPLPAGMKGFFNSLPTFNAAINGTTFFVLIASLVAIKRKNIKLHRQLIMAAMVLSVLFLLSYVGYHITHEEARYPIDAPNRALYLIILNSHIVLSGIIVPLVLYTFVRGISMKVEKHRKLAKLTLPIWLYVTATGVIVYFMIRPYYGF